MRRLFYLGLIDFSTAKAQRIAKVFSLEFSLCLRGKNFGTAKAQRVAKVFSLEFSLCLCG